MKRATWLFGTCLFVGLGIQSAAGAPAVSEVLEQWLAQLDDEHFARREEATRRLQEAGAPAVEVLARGVLTGSPEAAWRAGEALKQLAIQGDERVLDQVAAAFARLDQEGKVGLTGVVAEIRARQKQLKHDRAAGQIRALGGQLHGGMAGEDVAFFPGFGFGGFGGAVFVDVEEAPLGIPVIEVPLEAVPKFPVEIVEKVDKDLEPLEKPEAAKLREAVEEVLPLKAAEVPPPAPAIALPVPPEDAPPARDVAVEPVPAEDVPAPAILIGEGDIAFPFDGLVVEEVLLGGAVMGAPAGALQESLSLDTNWKGGDADLKALADLPDITSVTIQGAKLTDAALAHLAALPKLQRMHIQKTGFTSAGLREFRTRRPNVNLFAQGQAMLGIHADTSGPCVLTSIYAQSGAAEAGLTAGDRIVAVDGVAIADFADLTIAVFPHVAGDKLKVEFERGGEKKKVEVVLKGRATLEGRE